MYDNNNCQYSLCIVFEWDPPELIIHRAIEWREAQQRVSYGMTTGAEWMFIPLLTCSNKIQLKNSSLSSAPLTASSLLIALILSSASNPHAVLN